MTIENVKLDVGNASLTIIKPELSYCKEAMLVIPGGGYSCVCSDREGEPIAFAYVAKGMTTFMLDYSVGKDAINHKPLIEASAAIAYIRRNAEKYGIDKDKVYCVGFSAGGHLAASLATMWHRDEVIKGANIEYGENRPNAAVLCYPVINGFDMAHKGSFYNIIGSTTPSDEQLEYYSADLQVDENSSPAFLVHTANDQLVPVENSLYMAEAYAGAKVPFELHIYPNGPHGMALANKITSKGNKDWESKQYERWVEDSCIFVRSLNK